MKLYTFEVKGERRIGVERDGRLIDLPTAHGKRHASQISFSSDFYRLREMLEFIQGGEYSLKLAQEAVEFAADEMKTLSYDMKKVKILAPLAHPGKILCSGLNYRSHLEENPNATIPVDPRFFAKLPNTVIGPGEPIRHPGKKYQVDYEVELAVVIGKRMRRVSEAEALDHVFGYTILQDVSARYIQFKDNNEMMGKNFDTFAPMGPCIVTKDDIPHPEKLRLRLFLNGEIMQDGTNEDWIFPLPRLLSWLSSAMTLEPGDVVTTGTPAGVGYFRNPQVFLKPGDRVSLEIEGMGRLENPVKAVS